MSSPNSQLTAYYRPVFWPENPAVDEQTARALLNAVIVCEMDGVIVLDGQLRVVLFNHAAEIIFGCAAADVLGGTIDRFVPQSALGRHREVMRQLAERPSVCRRPDGGRLITGLRANGEPFPLEASFSHASADGQHVFTVFVRDATERREHERAIEESVHQLRSLSAHAHRMRDEERRRLARELHDDMGQLHAAIRMDIAALQNLLPDAPQAVEEMLQSLDRISARAVDSTRRLIDDLRPAVLEENDLTGAVTELCAEFARRHGIVCDFQRAGVAGASEEAIATPAFRLVQEALANVARHAQAGRVDVRMGVAAGELWIEVADDGRGMSGTPVPAEGKYGLIGMRERTLGLGGRFSVDSAPGHGTTIRAWLPLGSTPER